MEPAGMLDLYHFFLQAWIGSSNIEWESRVGIYSSTLQLAVCPTDINVSLMPADVA